MKPTLVVMAAGMSSRYGSLKQIEPVGRNGELIMEYSVYDAVRAGFGRVVFVVKKEFLKEFRLEKGVKMSHHIQVDYVCQNMRNFVPDNIVIPESRVKPWGTGHAVLCVKDVVREPFCVINADDFYGAAAFQTVSRFLQNADPAWPFECCMVGFRAENTLSEFGTVSRGVCQMDEYGRLGHVREYLTLMREGREIVDKNTGDKIPLNAVVSMNVWGFPAYILEEYEKHFHRFLREKDLSKDEFYIQDVVNSLMARGAATVEVLPVENKWYGVTYKQDREPLRSALADMHIYPEKLWNIVLFYN